jgi:hypothetical protein
MAAGCFVITTALGSLPEVTAGFAELVPPPGGRRAYRLAFDAKLRAWITAITGPDAAALRGLLVEQVRYVREHYAWPALAGEWERLLARVAAGA